jgi:hypothetical protein
MSPTLGVIIMMNNYFHDVATALLLASGVVMWVVIRNYQEGASPDTDRYFLRLYRSVTWLAKFSLLWIILGGIPRTIFYAEFEWANAAGKGQVTALIIKHILAFLFVGAGAHIWFKIWRKVKVLRKQSQ